ncbi:MAG: hypothetical protein EAZ08_13210 [Cytophagales bacterium]|nr:MAG: hypothetical protein EAZ08_13210 [Cytophagales bacterium]
MEEIKREAERAEAERKRKHEQMLKDNRMAVISNFESSEIPTSASMIKESKLYYFSYAYSQYDLTNEVPTIYVSSPFPVTKYADGTWPYEKDVLGEIRESTPYSPILHGNYPSLDAAQEAYNSFVRRLKNESVAVKTFDYEGKNAGSSTNSSTLDFWGNEKGEKKKVEKKTEAGAELDFWGNKVPNKKVAPKKTNKKTN